jgi:hypothetical protein
MLWSFQNYFRCMHLLVLIHMHHAYNPDGSLVKLRVTSVLNSTEILGNTRYHYKNDTSVIRTLGVDY